MTTYTHNLLINITGIPDNKEFHFIRTAAFKTVGEPCVMVFAPDTMTDHDRAALAQYLAA